MAEIAEIISSLLSGGATPSGSEVCILDFDTLTQILVVVGALNWGTIALSPDGSCGDFVVLLSEELARLLSGGEANEELATQIDRVIKGAVGIAGFYQLLNLILPLLPTPYVLYNPCLLVGSV